MLRRAPATNSTGCAPSTGGGPGEAWHELCPAQSIAVASKYLAQRECECRLQHRKVAMSTEIRYTIKWARGEHVQIRSVNNAPHSRLCSSIERICQQKGLWLSNLVCAHEKNACLQKGNINMMRQMVDRRRTYPEHKDLRVRVCVASSRRYTQKLHFTDEGDCPRGVSGE